VVGEDPRRWTRSSKGIANDTGVRIEEHLPVEAPGDAGTYIGMLRRDAEMIAAGLRG
jgi:ABC-type Zn uptake system ZnuABC Zn-binding protein ZnuA